MIEEHASYESSDGEDRDDRAAPRDEDDRSVDDPNKLFIADLDQTPNDFDKTVEEDDSRGAAGKRKSESQMRHSALESCDFLDLNSQIDYMKRAPGETEGHDENEEDEYEYEDEDDGSWKSGSSSAKEKKSQNSGDKASDEQSSQKSDEDASKSAITNKLAGGKMRQRMAMLLKEVKKEE